MDNSFVSKYKSSGRTKKSLYPSPFFSLSDFYLPTNIKDMFNWCKYFFMKDPIIGGVIPKLAQYPVTDFTYHVEDDVKEHKDTWEKVIEETLGLRAKIINMGLNYYTFGNSLTSIYFPFTRYLTCPKCGHRHDITNNEHIAKHWTFSIKAKVAEFNINCTQCYYNGAAVVNDVKDPTIEKINFIQWDVSNIEIEHYQITGESRYFYNMPKSLVSLITKGKDKHFLKTSPMEYLDAVAQGKMVELNPQNVFHWARWTLAGADQGWGKPLIIHSLQRLFYLYTLRRSQEAVAVQRILPLDIVFPQQTKEISPVDHFNLPQWQDSIRKELERWRADPNYIAVMPQPVGIERVGGDQKHLLLSAEIEQGNKEVTAGMGVPMEFAFGGLSWTGSSISLRMLENMFLSYRMGIEQFLRFVVDGVRKLKRLPKCTVKMTELRMADDIQRMQLVMQLNAQNKVSDEDMTAQFGYDLYDQWEKIEKEQSFRDKITASQMLGSADSQGAVMIRNAEYQAKAQIAGQKISNSAIPEIDESLPIIQKEAKKQNDLLQLKMIQLQMLQAQMQEAQMKAPPQQQGPPPPEEGGGQEGPPSEEGQEGPPPEEGGQEEQGGQPPQGGAAYMEDSAAEPPVVNKNQYGNPFYQKFKGVRPDPQAMMKNWATRILRMPPDERAKTLNSMRQYSAKMYQDVMMYMTLTPPGGTASDANNAFQ